MGDDFEDWMAAEARPVSGAMPIWERWPTELKAEIAKAVEFNDRGGDRVTVPRLCSRWVERYGVQVSRDTLRRYCREVLGRRSFSDKGGAG